MNLTACRLILLLSMTILCCTLSAQTTLPDPVTVPYSRLPYFEGFENADTVAKYWKINQVRRNKPENLEKLSDLWYLSTAEHYSGNTSLIVSDKASAGNYAIYGDKFARASSYIEFDLAAGQYDISFAWRCEGERMKDVIDKDGQPDRVDDPTGEGDGLFVALMPATVDVNSTDSKAPLPAAFLTKHTEMKGNGESYYGSQFWKVENLTVNVPTPGNYRLYFVWNNDGDGINIPPSAGIDNIQLAPSAGVCSKPDNLSCTVNGLDATLSWTGTAPEYEVRYREYGATNYLSTLPVITPGDPSGTTTITIKGIKEGLYDFFVRAICAPGDTSIWVVAPEIMFYDYQAEGRCINFTDLDAAELLIGGGHATSSTDYNKLKYREVNAADVDFGYETGRSRITVHKHPGEVDLRTDGKLKTIPAGEVMSVRLGTWNADDGSYGYGDGQGQKITYDYKVPALGSAQILLLNYALVLQIPVDGQHDMRDENGELYNMPHFTMDLYEVINGQEILLDATCNSANFYADYVYLDDPNSGWKPIYNKKEGGKLEIVYKDWAPVGFDLSKYSGKNLRIRFATYDCGPSGHFGYAYFTLRCIEATGIGMMCGNETSATLEAPYGFEYEWYRPSNTAMTTPDSKGRIFIDTKPELGKYTCKLKNTQTECVTDFFVDLKPRQPQSDFTCKPVPNKNCENLYEFTNISKVMIDGVVSTEEPEYFEWDFGPEYGGLKFGEKETILFPPQGDTIQVKIFSSINKQTCTDDSIRQVVIPSILIDRDTIEAVACGGNPYIFENADGKKHYLSEPGDTAIATRNIFGCELTTVVRLEVYDVDSVAILDTICEGETREFNGQNYYVIGSYKGGRYKASSGCDSVPWLHLFVREKVVWQPQLPAEICADDKEMVIPYSLVRGAAEAVGCSVEFGQKAIDAGFQDIDDIQLADSAVVIPIFDGVRPDHYSAQVIFSTDSCGDYPQPLDFTVAYPATVMQQKWDDVIALKNAPTIAAEIPGADADDYDFSAYKWYRNGAEIPGAIHSYIYLGRDGAVLYAVDNYSVLLTRTGENYTVPTCSMTPEPFVPKSDYPTLAGVQSVVAPGARMEVPAIDNSPAVTARWYSVDGRLLHVEQISDAAITAPMQQGIYLLHITTTETSELIRIVVR